MRKTATSHAMSRYTCVTEGVIDLCQRNYLAGLDMSDLIPDMSAATAEIIAVESLEGDKLLDAPPPVVVSLPLGDLSDWALAVLAEIVLFVAQDAHRNKFFPQSTAQLLEERGYAALEKALESSTASPMLWYEDIYFDVAQECWRRHDRRALDWIKRGLAHNLHYNEGNNALNMLRDLAEAYLWLGEPAPALAIFTAVLYYDPADIWTYNEMGMFFDQFGLAELGLVAIHRGMALLDVTGDPEQLQSQFLDFQQETEQSREDTPQVEVDPTVERSLRQALELDFAAGQDRPIAELCHEIVPDLPSVPIKRPAERPRQPRPRATAPAPGAKGPRPRPGRNDPCWCGSGKKYKKCHMAQDEGGG